MISKVWTKVASAADAGSVVTVTSSATAKIDLRLAAYTGTAANPVATVTKAVDTTVTTTHTTPAATVTGSGKWVLSYWADKSTATTAWTVPAGQTVRTTGTGTSSAHITAVLTDAGTAAAPGPAGGLTATADTAGNKATMLTIVLAQAG
jgi:hypothetical protein